jgi:hypothetical protein
MRSFGNIIRRLNVARADIKSNGKTRWKSKYPRRQLSQIWDYSSLHSLPSSPHCRCKPTTASSVCIPPIRKPPSYPEQTDLNGSGDYDYIRVPDDMYSNGPVTNVQSTDIICNKGAAARTTGTLTVAAGSTVSWPRTQKHLLTLVSRLLSRSTPPSATRVPFFSIWQEPPVAWMDGTLAEMFGSRLLRWGGLLPT